MNDIFKVNNFLYYALITTVSDKYKNFQQF